MLRRTDKETLTERYKRRATRGKDKQMQKRLSRNQETQQAPFKTLQGFYKKDFFSPDLHYGLDGDADVC